MEDSIGPPGRHPGFGANDNYWWDGRQWVSGPVSPVHGPAFRPTPPAPVRPESPAKYDASLGDVALACAITGLMCGGIPCGVLAIILGILDNRRRAAAGRDARYATIVAGAVSVAIPVLIAAFFLGSILTMINALVSGSGLTTDPTSDLWGTNRP